MHRLGTLTLVMAGAVCALTNSAPAAIQAYSFTNITNNNAANATIGRNQIFVEVFEGTHYGVTTGPNQAGFRFYNVGPAASSVTDVYFDDGTLLGIDSIYSSAGVDYSPLAKPENLPGGASLTVPFETTKGFSADSNPPVQPNGVNPGEWMTVVFDLKDGQDYDDIIGALSLGLTSPQTTGSLRIGAKVQGFANGGSESFINGPPESAAVPEPATLLAWSGLGLIFGWGAIRRRLRKTN